MEPAPVRDQARDFTRTRQALTGFVQAHNGLTALERKIVCNFVRALEEEVGPFSPEPSTDGPPLTATLSRAPRSTDSFRAHIHEAIFHQTGEYPNSRLFE